MKHKLNMLYFPFFDRKEDLQDAIARSVWYLSCMDELEGIYFPTYITDLDFEVPDYLDPTIGDMYPQIKDRINFVSPDNRWDLDDIYHKSDIILQWKVDTYPSPEWKARIEEQTDNVFFRGYVEGMSRKQLYIVDKDNERFEGSLYTKIGMANQVNRGKVISRLKHYMLKLMDRLSDTDKAYVFGTGPTADLYPEFDFSDGVSIICNSIILDESLMEHVKPKVIAFADPIFHFGCSRYAHSFRETLLEAVEKYDLSIVIPFNYHRLFTHNLPGIKSRVYSIPMSSKHPVNLNLKKDFYIKSISNILTLLMMPIACTISDNINMIGFDGRKTADNRYFWKHNPKTQFYDKMDNIKQVHPAFFDIDYNAYYTKHQQTLEEWLDKGKEDGKTFRMLTPSYIPSLRRFYEFRGKHYEWDFYPSVTIVMPYYGIRTSIRSAVDSVLKLKHYENWELLIVCDEYDNETKDMLQSIQELDKRIVLVYSDSKDITYALNKGIIEAKGKYITFLEPECIYYPDSLAMRMEELIDKDYDAVFCTAMMVDDELNELGWIKECDNDMVSFLQMHKTPFHVNTVIIKKDKLIDDITFSQNNPLTLYWDIYQRLARKGVVFHNVKGAFIGYRQDRYIRLEDAYTSKEEVIGMLYKEDERIKHPKPEYSKGLVYANMLYHKQERLIKLVLSQILYGKEKTSTNLSRDLSPVLLYLILMDLDKMIIILKDIIAKVFECHIDEWVAKLYENKDRLIEGLLELISEREDANEFDFVNDIELNILINRLIESERQRISNIKSEQNKKDKEIVRLKNELKTIKDNPKYKFIDKIVKIVNKIPLVRKIAKKVFKLIKGSGKGKKNG